MQGIIARVDNATTELELYGAGAKVHLERAASEAGPFTEIDEQSLVAGTDIYTFADDAVSTSWYRFFLSKADDSDASESSEPFQVRPPLVVTAGQVRALVETPLSDVLLEEIISREQDLLADEIGPLTGERTEVITVSAGATSASVRTRRRTATGSLSVLANGATTTDLRLGGDGRTITPLASSGYQRGYWAGALEVTYTPADRAKVETWLIELVRARLATTGFASETAETYSYTAGPSHDEVMAAAKRDLLAKRSALRSIGVSTGYVAPAWAGTVRPS